jgi:hypothetical protein
VERRVPRVCGAAPETQGLKLCSHKPCRLTWRGEAAVRRVRRQFKARGALEPQTYLPAFPPIAYPFLLALNLCVFYDY